MSPLKYYAEIVPVPMKFKLGMIQDIKMVTDIKKIYTLIEKGYQICIWGTGYIGKVYGYNILKYLQIKPDYFCDNNDKLWGEDIVDHIPCIDFTRIIHNPKVIWMVFVAEYNQNSVVKQLKEYNVEYILTINDIVEMSNITREYFPFMKQNKCAVYTCIVDNYDNLQEPSQKIPGYDYYVISDKKIDSDIYEWIDINKIVPSEIQDPTRKNRYCKINTHLFLQDYSRSIYHDGNILIQKNMDMFFEELKETGIAVIGENNWKCLYKEAMRVSEQKRDDPDIIYQQVKKYWNEGMPENYGSCLGGLLVREHNTPICKKIMNEWWEQISSYSKRDQISFPYVLWKNGYKISDITLMSNCIAKQTESIVYVNPYYENDYWMIQTNHNVPRIKGY